MKKRYKILISIAIIIGVGIFIYNNYYWPGKRMSCINISSKTSLAYRGMETIKGDVEAGCRYDEAYDTQKSALKSSQIYKCVAWKYRKDAREIERIKKLYKENIEEYLEDNDSKHLEEIEECMSEMQKYYEYYHEDFEKYEIEPKEPLNR